MRTIKNNRVDELYKRVEGSFSSATRHHRCFFLLSTFDEMICVGSKLDKTFTALCLGMKGKGDFVKDRYLVLSLGDSFS